MEKALNPIEIEKIAGTPIILLKYSQLCLFNTMEELFDKGINYVLLLYETKLNNGHWVCLINHPDSVEFFDSYAFVPDDELKFTNLNFKKQNNMDLPYLTYLMLNSKKPIEYNDYKFQSWKQGVHTCGRWVGFRIRLSHSDNFSLEDFIEMFKKFYTRKNYDLVITKLTDPFLRK